MIRVLKPITVRVGGDIEVVMDGGITRGSDVVKTIALGARRGVRDLPAARWCCAGQACLVVTRTGLWAADLTGS